MKCRLTTKVNEAVITSIVGDIAPQSTRVIIWIPAIILRRLDSSIRKVEMFSNKFIPDLDPWYTQGAAIGCIVLPSIQRSHNCTSAFSVYSMKMTLFISMNVHISKALIHFIYIISCLYDEKAKL